MNMYGYNHVEFKIEKIGNGTINKQSTNKFAVYITCPERGLYYIVPVGDKGELW